ncbi:MAG: CHRD domain-containing protein [Burkholderiaceae bacterium]
MTRLLMKALFGLLSMVVLAPAHATIINLQTMLSGANENPIVGTPGTGSATVVIDTILNTMFVGVTFSGLTAVTSASHIHCCAVAPLNAGVATTTPSFAGFPLGVTSGSYASTLDLTLLSSYNPAFVALHGGTALGAEAFLVAGMTAGQSYLNIHTVSNPGGEIRGQLLVVPEPETLALLAGAILFGALGGRRRRAR